MGVAGQNVLRGPLSLSSAIKEYEDKLYDKTVKGDYRILEIVNDDGEEKSIIIFIFILNVFIFLKRGRNPNRRQN